MSTQGNPSHCRICLFAIIFCRVAFTIALLSFILATEVVAATVAVTKEDKCNIVITLSGPIDDNTEKDLVAAYNLLNKENLKKCRFSTLDLNSSGGDVAAAMRVGDFVRQKKMQTTVNNRNSCASACVLIFLGGVTRSVWNGKIGLHRPYSTNYSTSESAARDAYERINRNIREYLNRMNIPDGLLNIMNSVPPDKINWLTDQRSTEKLKELFIVGTDPVWADQEDSLEAKRLGISKQVLYTRRNKIEVICGNPFDDKYLDPVVGFTMWDNCTKDVLAGKL